MHIRPADDSEFEPVASMMHLAQEAHVNACPYRYAPLSQQAAKAYLRQLASGDAQLIIAVEDACVCGYAIFEFLESPVSVFLKPRRYCYLQQIGVLPRFRQKGVGRELLDYVKRCVIAARLTEIELDVWAFNTEAKQFFEKAGYQTVAAKMRLDLLE